MGLCVGACLSMSLTELFLLAVSLSMDAFAVAVCVGMTMATFKKALVVGLYFGAFQAGMPILGYFAASLFANAIIAYDHWIVFTLLSYIGGKMIYEGFKKDERPAFSDNSLKPATMLPLAVATSIDAMAVGISCYFFSVKIIPSAALIGATTLIIAMAGVKIGNIFGVRFKSKAEFAGGIILILIGLKILLEHINAINFA